MAFRRAVRRVQNRMVEEWIDVGHALVRSDRTFRGTHSLTRSDPKLTGKTFIPEFGILLKWPKQNRDYNSSMTRDQERCAICGCQLHRSGEYATPTVAGRSHATEHHY